MRIFDTLNCCTEAEGRDYAANELNQYTAIDSFAPTYDLDGNQTKIFTSTGEWQVEYNAENRPVRWTQGNIEIEMAYDRMGRRISYHETRNGANYINAKFVYNGYLCIQRLYGSSNGVYQSFVWDPTEPTATRPLCMQVPSWGSTVFYMHDGNKNVSDLIYYALANGIAAHYDYAPFGAVTRTARNTRMTQHTFIAENPFRFSSEYHDNSLGLVYYNYRHYNPKDGRWCGRDPLEEEEGLNLYQFCKNNVLLGFDFRGTSSAEYREGSCWYNFSFTMQLKASGLVQIQQQAMPNYVNMRVLQKASFNTLLRSFGKFSKNKFHGTEVDKWDLLNSYVKFSNDHMGASEVIATNIKCQDKAREILERSEINFGPIDKIEVRSITLLAVDPNILNIGDDLRQHAVLQIVEMTTHWFIAVSCQLQNM